MATLALTQRVDLVDDDGADVAQILPGPQGVVDPLVGADDHVGLGVEAVAVAVDPARPDPQGHVDHVAVAFFEGLVLLIGQRDEGNEKQHLPLAVEHPVEACHLADERLPGRRRRDD